ncbi:putative WASH complex subunit 7 N terminal WASH complex subunit 7 WASH complex subunit 7 C terminal [Trypanosoma vivax]|uniref:WASH complex subunit 7 central domain-containing protein n=1 Tax=Trypanosoma vivax (strain Y486) TaxID=1055687 RepID=F9WU84_TRYVY|nr:putative WASH complex subunit 7 N terminal WASH complex subunit 7 WASH complex subunit 7 C terminal [Trypanosoma vivax]CCD21132.1 hypothetical protein, conserved [Trypanosoma vivax Y486]|eukprot:CCD21132.1 hypothetical protein, conserved [Trypanosoma vivax Y486]
MLTTYDFGVNIEKEEEQALQEKLRLFVSGYEKMLLAIQQAMDKRWDAMLWDPHTDVLSVQLVARVTPYGLREPHDSLANTLGREQRQNRLFYRITVSLASLVLEMQSLTNEANDVLIPPLAMFYDDECADYSEEKQGDADRGDDVESLNNEEAQQFAGRTRVVLHKTWSWSHSVQKVVLHVVQQLASVYALDSMAGRWLAFANVRYHAVWRALTGLLGKLVCVEEVLSMHETLSHDLATYRKMLAQVSRNPDKFEFEQEKLEQFCALLNKMEGEVLDDGLLERVVCQRFDVAAGANVREAVQVRSNRRLFDEFTQVLTESVASVCSSLEANCKDDSRLHYIGVLGLYYMHLRLYPRALPEDKHCELTKRIFILQREMPVIYIRGTNVFRPSVWMSRCIANELRFYHLDAVKDVILSTKEHCRRSKATFHPHMRRLTTLVSVWISEMGSNSANAQADPKAFAQAITVLLQRGVLLARSIQRLVVNHISLHNSADAAITLQDVDTIANGVQMLMMIRATYHARTGVVATSFDLVVRSIKYVMERHLHELYQAVSETLLHGSSADIEDQYSAIRAAIDLLHKPQTLENLLCLELVFCVIFHRRGASAPERLLAAINSHREDVLIAFSQLRFIVTHQTSFRAATDCDFLYWQREAFYPIFFKRLYQKPLNSSYLPYLVLAIHDCRASVLSACHVTSVVDIFNSYVSYTRECLHKYLIDPLCVDIENDLRQFTHSAVLGQVFLRDEPDSASRDVARFTRLPPFRFFGEWLHIAEVIEQHLDEKFYNLNALMVNDWKTYEEMRNLALERYGLRICNGSLPGSIVDHGLDVLVITENIQVFVANYTYNMNEQLFVQRPSTTESKHLHTLHIRHIANSIRTHGTGIMNTTVNYVYKCLLKKLAIVSQFLSDDHVKSRLIKDVKQFNEKRGVVNNEYTLAQAEKFIREMRKLGVAHDGQTFIAKLCSLVSEIGNAIAYMRMMRSGGLRAVADSAVFVPFSGYFTRLECVLDSDASGSEDEVDKGDGHAGREEKTESESDEKSEDAPVKCKQTLQAMRAVDQVVGNMRKKLSEGSDYFHMLLEAVTRRLKGAIKYTHLKNFHMIIPPICVLHVEMMVREKEQLVKKNKDGIFTDDGFALGCAFLLKLFGVWDSFESLHWFESVRNHYGARLRAIKEGISAHEQEVSDRASGEGAPSPYGVEDVSNMHLTAMMLETVMSEFTTLEEAFVSSKVFFYSASLEAGIDVEKQEEEAAAEKDTNFRW